MHRNIMGNSGATPASALRMGEFVPRGQRNNKDIRNKNSGNQGFWSKTVLSLQS